MEKTQALKELVTFLDDRMLTTVDDQEILKLKKLPEKKMRSRNCFISSSSLGKEDLKVNQFVDGENTTVYALVEVTKDSEKPAKREKIPLNNKDFFQVMQKFMVSRREKSVRKVRKPSKRKHVSESASESTNMSKDEKNIENDAQALGIFSDETNVIYKRSNLSGIDSLRNTERGLIRRRMHSGDESEFEQPQLKILFNRNNLVSQEPRMKRERLSLVSEETNTDIVQTPKVLAEALEALTSNFHPEKACDKMNMYNGKSLCVDGCGKDMCKPVLTAAQNFILVPFIIANNQVTLCRKTNSHEFIKNDDKFANNVEFIVSKTDRSQISSVGTTQKCLTENQSDISSMNTDQISNTTFTETKTDQGVKNELIQEKDQESKDKTNPDTDLTISAGICLLEEVKLLQKRLNAVVEGLDMRTLTCLHKLDISMNNDILLNGTDDQFHEEPSNEKPFQINCKDCGVQAVIVTPQCDKTVAVPSSTVINKSMNRLIQYPSEANIETPARPSTFKRLYPYRKPPFLQTKLEYRYVTVRRTSSMVTFSKRYAETGYLQLTNPNFNYEGSIPEDEFDEDLEVDEYPRKSNDEPHRSEKCTNILFKKNNEAPNGKDKTVTVKQCGKIAKIKIVGNTTLTKENRDSDVEKIKLELNELGSIKISNKFNKRTKNITNNDICHNSNSSVSYCKAAISNVSSNVKELENNKKVSANGKTETLSRIARRETKPKKVGETAKATGPKKEPNSDSPQMTLKASKLKKPSTPVRIFSRAKEEACSSIKSPRIPIPIVSVKTEEAQLMKAPQAPKVAEKQVNSSGTKEFLAPEKTGGTAHEPEEFPGKTEGEVSCDDKQSPPLKSIWVLTKVDLYEDGIQSFEILEASSHPLKYQSNKKADDNTPIELPNYTKTNNNESNIVNPINKNSRNALILYKNVW